MKRVKHVIFWLVVIGIILLLFSSHVIAEDVFRQQRQAIMTGDLLNLQRTISPTRFIF